MGPCGDVVNEHSFILNDSPQDGKEFQGVLIPSGGKAGFRGLKVSQIGHLGRGSSNRIDGDGDCRDAATRLFAIR